MNRPGLTSAPPIRRFLDKGGIIVWGIVPTGVESFGQERIDSLDARLTAVWDQLARRGLDIQQIVAQGMLSPATCCLVNPDKTLTVEKAFEYTRLLSRRMKERYGLT